MRRQGYPAYTTSTGWLGYSDEKVRRLCREADRAGLDRVQDEGRPEPRGQPPPRGGHARGDRPRPPPDDGRQPVLGRGRGDPADEGAGAVRPLVDRGAHQPRRRAGPRAPSRAPWLPSAVATGETCQNRVIFKQLLQAEAIRFLQVDSCRMGGVNEALAVILHGRPLRRGRLPARRRRGPVRVRAAPLDLRLHRGQRLAWRTASANTWTTCTSTSWTPAS